MQQVLISDANVLIDMEEGRLLKEIFELPFRFSIPDILFVEEMEKDHPNLPDIGLIIETLLPESMEHAMELIPRYKKASRNDIFALCLAKQKRCPLITGDMALRKAANAENVEVKGTVWLMDQLVARNIISREDACDAYDLMKKNGRRLPWNVIKNKKKMT